MTRPDAYLAFDHQNMIYIFDQAICIFLSMWWHKTHIWNQTHIFSPNDTRHIPYYMRIRPEILLKRTRLLKHKFFEKVSQTLRYEFLDFCVHISKIARFLGENISSPTLYKVTSVLIQSDPTFFRCVRETIFRFYARINLGHVT